ncbi:Apolipoprotein A-V [Dissostichus eleginoides]|uniref:Apolipoprotein A-V n=1 Tax=Dissostichus eleginoides TaxID=100907 RepID=A0AAD9BZU8_DISEL|nr:Apolipoprotein A-V [Dissostichus eleginoides]
MAALKERARSAVWEYYTQTTQGKAVCNTCKVGVSMVNKCKSDKYVKPVVPS